MAGPQAPRPDARTVSDQGWYHELEDEAASNRGRKLLEAMARDQANYWSDPHGQASRRRQWAHLREQIWQRDEERNRQQRADSRFREQQKEDSEAAKTPPGENVRFQVDLTRSSEEGSTLLGTKPTLSKEERRATYLASCERIELKVAEYTDKLMEAEEEGNQSLVSRLQNTINTLQQAGRVQQAALTRLEKKVPEPDNGQTILLTDTSCIA